MTAIEAFEKYKIGLNGRDIGQLIPLISEQCDFWHPTGSYHGKAQAQKGFEKIWKTIEAMK